MGYCADMGCRQAKQKVSKANGPDGFDAIPEPGTPPPVDPRLPINARQVFKLKKSWKGIKRNMEATGVEMFIRSVNSSSVTSIAETVISQLLVTYNALYFTSPLLVQCV